MITRWFVLILFAAAIGCSSSDKKPSLSRHEREIKERRAMYGLETPGMEDRE